MFTVRPEIPEDSAAIQVVDALATTTLRETYCPNEKAHANKARISPGLTRLVALVENRVVGTVQYYRQGNSIRVIGLGVHTDFRRQGVARVLLESLAAIGKREDAKRLHLYTVKETGNAVVFERLGFTVVREKDDEFSKSDKHRTLTDVEMQRSLDDGNIG